MTKDQINALSSDQLRAIIRTTKADGSFWQQLSWARDEMERRIHGITISQLAETSIPWGENRSPTGLRG